VERQERGVNFYRHYIGDFQRDTGHLSLSERGAYRALMDYYYATEKALPNDLDALCRVAGAVNALERKAVKSAMAMFEFRDGMLWHKRIEAELEKAGERADTNREIALAREARKRAEKGARTEHEQSTIRAPDVVPDAPRIDHALSTKPLTSKNQEESTAPPTPRKRGADRFDPMAVKLPDWLPPETWGDWVKSRGGKGLTEIAVGRQLRALTEWRAKGHDPVSIIDTSIRNGWTGLFEPKGRANGYQHDDVMPVDPDLHDLLVSEARKHMGVQ
jgi:uncharacterized protein YdaU (DUF1376 family)